MKRATGLTYCAWLVALATVIAPSNAAAQLSRAGGSIDVDGPGTVIRGSDTAFDPVNNVYLIVHGNGPVFGIFVNTAGQPVTSRFTLFDGATGWATFPRAVYSPDVPNGVGGLGGFLVVWHQGNGIPNFIYGRLVAFQDPDKLVTGAVAISGGEHNGSYWEGSPTLAYSRTSRRFLVAWNTFNWTVLGRFVDTNGAQIGNVFSLQNHGVAGVGARDPSMVWNAATDEFGLVYTEFNDTTRTASVSFRRIRATDGFRSDPLTFGFAPSTFATAIDLNNANQYVMAWALHPGTRTMVVDKSGTQLMGSSGAFVAGTIGYDHSLGMSYNRSSGTFLAVGSDSNTFEVGAVEINGNGEPRAAAAVVTDGARLGSFNPATSAHASAKQWNVVYSRDFQAARNQIISTTAADTSYAGGGGGTPPPPSPTPPPPAPPPPPPPGGCGTPDPFAVLGGGTCCNGGWLPPGLSCSSGGSTPPPPAPTPAPTPTPTPTPAPSNCSTPNPFASLGGGTCCNGGWIPPGMSCAGGGTPSPAPNPTPSCTTPRPGAGEWQCVNGGWVPLTCNIPDPFVSIGGGVCVNGGWVPRSLAGGLP